MCVAAGGCPLEAPIENMMAPPTGWPSAEITRQLSTCVPAARPGGSRNDDGSVLGFDIAHRNRLAAWTDETDHQRRDRLVEGQLQRRGRRRNHRAVRRLRLHQGCMRPRGGRMREHDQERREERQDERSEEPGARPHHFLGKSFSAGQAQDNRAAISLPPESRSSDECPSRIPAPPGNRGSRRLRDRPQRSRRRRTHRNERRASCRR